MKAYIAIRKSVDGHEWMDLDTISSFLTESGNKSQKGNKECGLPWAKDNPMVRIVEVTITEEKTVFPV